MLIQQCGNFRGVVSDAVELHCDIVSFSKMESALLDVNGQEKDTRNCSQYDLI